MRIGVLSEKAGISRDSIRFYEKIGLLPPPQRSANGYRYYPEGLVEQLKLLNHAKELGFSLKEIKEISELFLSKKLSRKQMNSFLARKNDEIDEKILELKKFKKEIEIALSGKCEYNKQVFSNENRI